MGLRQRIYLLGAAALGLPLIELLLSSLGIALKYRIPVVLVLIAAIAYASMSEFRGVFTDLQSIRKAINDTARGEFASAIEVARKDEIGELANSVRAMREQLGEMGRRLVESLRIESLNILGSILVHDMKNLAFRLRSLGQNLDANYADPAFRESLVLALSDTSEKMNQMVRRFRKDSQNVVVKIRMDVHEVIHCALDNLRREGDRIRISERYDKLPLLWADPMLLEKAFFNIVENARDAMPRGGEIAVRSRLVGSAEQGDCHAVIEIADNGIGMSDEFVRTSLFAPFITTKPRGLGLGLYTSLQIIQLHGGDIKVRSELARGTVFSIHLPVTD